MFTRRAALKKILINFEAEGRIDMKSKKKKVYTSADVPCLPLKIGEEQKTKKGLHVRRCPFFTDIQREAAKQNRKKKRSSD